MICKACTTLKKADTDGRIPAYTLDQYVRGELGKQLIDAVKPALSIQRANIDSPTVDFIAELVLLTSEQWQHLKDMLSATLTSLPPEQQIAAGQLIATVEDEAYQNRPG